MQALRTPPFKTIVIAGGGFAGTTLARSLGADLPDGWQIVLVSEESSMTFNPMLAEVVGAAVFPEQVIVPIREMLGDAPASRFVMGRIDEVDLERRVVQACTLAGRFELAYEHLVLAIGQRANLNLIPGLAQHALPLKLIGDAMAIRNRVLQRLARMELVHNAAERRALGHFVVIGGGFSGVEVAGAIADFVSSARRSYRRVAAGDIMITLLHEQDRLLPELPPALGDAALRSLVRRDIDVRLHERVARVEADAVVLDDGMRLRTQTVVCTIGTRTNPLVERLALTTTRGRIVTEGDGRVPGHDGLWALGDCAATPNAIDGRVSPPTAQFAVAQAEQMAVNLFDAIERAPGLPTRPFAYRSRGMMATTGHRRAVALLFGVPLTGLPAWLAWRAFYLMRMPTFGRKLRIWVEWTWSLFFPADITHLRFTRSDEVDVRAGRPDVPAPPAVLVAIPNRSLEASCSSARPR